MDADKELVLCGLDECREDAAYHCGRLLAVLQHLQDLATREKTGTYVSQFFSAASSRPAYILTPIFRRAQHRLKQIKSGRLRGDMESLLIRVHNSIQAFPTHLTIIEQGAFQLGYFHQLPGMPDNDMRRRLPTKGGYAVKSAGEQFIASLLFDAGIKHEYEQPLPIPGLEISLSPDFTLTLDDGFRKVYIEYVGMLGDEDYDNQARWKAARYRKELECRTLQDVLTDKNLTERTLMELFPDDLADRRLAREMILGGLAQLNRIASAVEFQA